jgi:hypothetical protein
MKKKLLLLVAAIALALLVPAAVMAQSPGGLAYTSGIQVVNLDSTTASIGLTYYNQDGSEAATAVDTIGGNSSKTYFPIQADPGFNGSLVISSDKPITAIANTITTDNKYGAATTSFSSGSTSVNLPLVMCNNNGFNTWFNVQNTGSSTASVTINYTAGSDGVDGSENASIEPGAAKTFDQAAGSSTKNCGTLGAPKFIGSATVTSNQPVAVTLMQLGTGGFNILMGYNGFTSASSEVALPLIMANNSGYYTGMQVQNTGNNATTATVDYGANLGGAYNPPDDTCNLDPGESCTLIQNSGPWTGNKFVGSATVSASEELVVIVNQVSLGSGGKGPFGTAYEGFDPSVATNNIIAPLIMANNSGYYTGVQVMNVGGSACSVSMDYGPNTAGGFNPATENFSIDPDESWTVIQQGAPPANGGSNNWGTNKYVGSAEISGTGSCELIAIINEAASLAGDNLFTYIGYNH